MMMNLPNKFSNENVLVIVLDSCRWDVFVKSNTPNIDRLTKIRKANTNATFTYPAHLAMYQGYFPSTSDDIPYYDRKNKPLIRIGYDGCKTEGLINFKPSTKDIITGFGSIGYKTLGLGSTGWFSTPQLTDSYSEFYKTSFSICEQVDIVSDKLFSNEQPFFCLMNIGDTHCPYGLEGYSEKTKILELKNDGISDTKFFQLQKNACEKVDRELAKLFSKLESIERNTIVLITADHGECFGEDGMYGHGIFHQKVAEVPIGVFMMGKSANNGN